MARAMVTAGEIDAAAGYQPPPGRSVAEGSSRWSDHTRLDAWRILRGIETLRDLDAHHGQPRPSSRQPDYTLLGPDPITALQGQTTDEAPATLDAKRLTLVCAQRSRA
jgi:hypothetical protein